MAGTGFGLATAQRLSLPAALPPHAGLSPSDADSHERSHLMRASAAMEGLEGQQTASSLAPAPDTHLERGCWHAPAASQGAAAALASTDPVPVSAAAILQAGTFGGAVGQRGASAAATSRAEPDLCAASAAAERPPLASASRAVPTLSGGSSAVERASAVGASQPGTPLGSALSAGEPASAASASQPEPVLSRSASAVHRASAASISLPGSIFSRTTSLNVVGAVKVIGAPSGTARWDGSGPVSVQGDNLGVDVDAGGPSPVSVLSSMALQQAPLAGA